MVDGAVGMCMLQSFTRENIEITIVDLCCENVARCHSAQIKSKTAESKNGEA